MTEPSDRVEECGVTLTMPHPDYSDDCITQTHVCGLPPNHDVDHDANRRHRCRKPDCNFWWEELDYDPFLEEPEDARD